MNLLIESEKTRMKTNNVAVINALEKHFENVPVFRDIKSKSEFDGQLNYFIFETGDFLSVEDSKTTIKQFVHLTYVSHHNGKLDEDILDVISIMKSLHHTFVQAEKNVLQLGAQDDYVDQVIFRFTRGIKIGC